VTLTETGVNTGYSAARSLPRKDSVPDLGRRVLAVAKDDVLTTTYSTTAQPGRSANYTATTTVVKPC